MLARGVLFASAMLLYSPTLYAQPAPPVTENATLAEEPWKIGVSVEKQAAASALVETASDLFVQRHYLGALDTYRKALALWNHPALHFDVALCLLELDRPVEALEQLEQALVYGKHPLGDDLYANALEYRKLLSNQIGEVVVTCDDAEVAVAIDGRAVASCIQRPVTRVAPGEHFVVGSRRGYLTETRKVSVFGGRRTTVAIAPVPLDQAGIEVRRWPVFVPWTVLGAGILVGGAAGFARLAATNDMAAYDTAIRQGCRTTGCDVTMVNEPLRRRAIRENQIAIGIGAVGAAAVITGSVLLYLNRAERIYPTVETAPGGATFGVRGTF